MVMHFDSLDPFHPSNFKDQRWRRGGSRHLEK